MKIVVFTGAGISKESGIETFRDNEDSLWNNYKIEDVATINGWKKDRELVLNFYNERRKQLLKVEPNKAHLLLAELEKEHEVTIITQNVDNLHEKAGSTKIFHLHGELTKSQSSLDPKLVYDCDTDIKIGDKCEKGSQLRPHVVWFGEYPNNVKESYDELNEADVLLIIGTSLQIGYTIDLLSEINTDKTSVYYIDPDPSKDLEHTLCEKHGPIPVEYIRDIATKGVEKFIDIL
jgi:NAD-dependent deacetylase